MKLNTKALLAAGLIAATPSASFGAQAFFNLIDSTNGQFTTVVDAAGDLIPGNEAGPAPQYNTSSYIGLGGFGLLTDAQVALSAAAGTLANDFILYASGNFGGEGIGGADGVSQWSANNPISNGKDMAGDTVDLTGADVYVVFGNAATLGSSDQVGIYKPGTQFPNDPSPFATNFTTTISDFGPLGSLGFGNDAVIYGTAIAGVDSPTLTGFGGVPPNQTDSTTLQLGRSPIPEPSAAVFALLGALGLALRRRK